MPISLNERDLLALVAATLMKQSVYGNQMAIQEAQCLLTNLDQALKAEVASCPCGMAQNVESCPRCGAKPAPEASPEALAGHIASLREDNEAMKRAKRSLEAEIVRLIQENRRLLERVVALEAENRRLVPANLELREQFQACARKLAEVADKMARRVSLDG